MVADKLKPGVTYYQEFTEDVSGMDHDDYERFVDAIAKGLEPVKPKKTKGKK